ncbi:uncharacterized protein LOC124406386 [Diprion similis]|uniref:uncharacterized protein LOC124406386 n=1 Tax=Diprion similis TaxID=362088 RepID=UPI001EF763F0|nr:uncharacterized protein LOC124406386 [Diprion similis]
MKEEKKFSVSGDGTWKKRGFKSLYGVTTLIGYYSGKVVDLVVKSSYCQGCTFWKNKTHTKEYEEWFEDHEENCLKNHEGSAGKMEVDSMIEIFSRSEEKFGVRYGNYIGDGNSKTFKAILELSPYGDELTVVKSECIGHVEKRMGPRLRNVRKEKKLSGRGKLTDKVVKKLTKYYGLSIQRNVNSVENMKKRDYGYFPKLEDLSPLLHKSIQKHLLPIYQDLSRDDLLKRCLGGHTQNANESSNLTIWRLAPKHLHSGLKIVEISAYIAAGIFNDGFSSILRIMNALDIVVGTNCRVFAETSDEARIVR